MPGDISSQFFQYSSGIADSSYAFDFVVTITIPAATAVPITFPTQENILRIRAVVVSDVTAAKGGTAPTKIACYFRIDGQPASAAQLSDGSSSRIVLPSSSKAINRFVASESGISVFNPNAAAITIQVELGG